MQNRHCSERGTSYLTRGKATENWKLHLSNRENNHSLCCVWYAQSIHRSIGENFGRSVATTTAVRVLEWSSPTHMNTKVPFSLLSIRAIGGLGNSSLEPRFNVNQSSSISSKPNEDKIHKLWHNLSNDSGLCSVLQIYSMVPKNIGVGSVYDCACVD